MMIITESDDVIWIFQPMHNHTVYTWTVSRAYACTVYAASARHWWQMPSHSLVRGTLIIIIKIWFFRKKTNLVRFDAQVSVNMIS